MTPEQSMERGAALARQAAGAGVLENHLAQILAHLRRHRDLAATLGLLEALPRSPFAERSRGTRRQFHELERLLAPELKALRDWRAAAAVVGWAGRLLVSFQR